MRTARLARDRLRCVVACPVALIRSSCCMPWQRRGRRNPRGSRCAPCTSIITCRKRRARFRRFCRRLARDLDVPLTVRDVQVQLPARRLR